MGKIFLDNISLKNTKEGLCLEKKLYLCRPIIIKIFKMLVLSVLFPLIVI